MSIKHLLSIASLSSEELAGLVDRSAAFAAGGACRETLDGKIIGLYFQKPSTRTRTAFAVGALKLGAQIVTYGGDDLQTTTGETIEDTARVLSGYLDALVVRTNKTFKEMEAWTCQDRTAIVNAMSENEHPTQAIADLSTLKEAFRSLEGLSLLYLGEGNNTAAALALAVARTPGMKITFVTPEGYGLKGAILDEVHETACRHGAMIEHHHRIDKLPRNVDAVYTTRWRTMGEPHAEPDWQRKFAPFSVTMSMIRRVSKSSGTVFLHDLPAVRGEDVAEEALDCAQSLAWRQAQHKLFSAMAILEWCLTSKRKML
jgi:ornithine carbamoyltransferase